MEQERKLSNLFYDEWHNYSKMESYSSIIYKEERKVFISKMEESSCQIIELLNNLSLLCPNDYIFSEREL